MDIGALKRKLECIRGWTLADWTRTIASLILFGIGGLLLSANIQTFIVKHGWDNFLTDAVSAMPDISPLLENPYGAYFYVAFGAVLGIGVILWADWAAVRLRKPAFVQLPPCPVLVLLDIFSNVSRFNETVAVPALQDSGVPSLGLGFGSTEERVTRTVWSVTVHNPPNSPDVSNVRVQVHSIQPIPRNPADSFLVIPRNMDAFLMFEGTGSTSVNFSPDMRVQVPVISHVPSRADRGFIRVESNPRRFVEHQDRWQTISVRVTCDGYSALDLAFEAGINNHGEVEMRAPALQQALHAARPR